MICRESSDILTFKRSRSRENIEIDCFMNIKSTNLLQSHNLIFRGGGGKARTMISMTDLNFICFIKPGDLLDTSVKKKIIYEFGINLLTRTYIRVETHTVYKRMK